MTEMPRFAIVNTFDGPSKRMVAEWIDGVGYCYMDRSLKEYDGMRPERPTAIEDFGFDVEIHSHEAVFTKTRESIATYEDRCVRKWQDPSNMRFKLPLVLDAKKTKKRARR